MPTPQLALVVSLTGLLAFACNKEGPGPEPADGDGGGDPQACSEAQCGPKPGMPNALCQDGVTMSGPGECKAIEGQCGWEIVECPDGQGTKTCGGIGALQCPEGMTCVDDPNDSCDPGNGGADCGGICQPGG
jgi:hypothetical protein